MGTFTLVENWWSHITGRNVGETETPVNKPPEQSTDIRTVCEILEPRLVGEAETYVQRSNAQSVDERDKAALVDLACAKVEALHRPFTTEERVGLENAIENLRQTLQDSAADIGRAEARFRSLDQSLGPTPRKERAAVAAVIAAVAMYAVGIGMSIKPAFSDLADDDPQIAWAYAILFGLTGGVITTWSILGLQGRGKD